MPKITCEPTVMQAQIFFLTYEEDNNNAQNNKNIFMVVEQIVQFRPI